MQVDFMWVSWISGIAFFAAFVLTFWPSRNRLLVAAALWVTGTMTVAWLSDFQTLVQGWIAHGFWGQSSGFPLLNWLMPLVSTILVFVESALLFPWFEQKRALRVGKILFLVIVPAYLIYASLPDRHMPFYFFPLGISWLGLPLLWFRIRENLK